MVDDVDAPDFYERVCADGPSEVELSNRRFINEGNPSFAWQAIRASIGEGKAIPSEAGEYLCAVAERILKLGSLPVEYRPDELIDIIFGYPWDNRERRPGAMPRSYLVFLRDQHFAESVDRLRFPNNPGMKAELTLAEAYRRVADEWEAGGWKSLPLKRKEGQSAQEISDDTIKRAYGDRREQMTVSLGSIDETEVVAVPQVGCKK